MVCLALKILKLFRLIMGHRLQRIMLVKCKSTIFTHFFLHEMYTFQQGGVGGSGASLLPYVKQLNILINSAIIYLTLPVHFLSLFT